MDNETSQTTFDELGLSEPVMKAVRDLGFEKPTPIQAQAIPLVLEGRDIVGASQTGAGKTAAFGLPAFSKMAQHGKCRCLVLEPTRELAAQVLEQFEIYGKHMDLSMVLLHGGVGYQPQLDKLNAGVDVIIATPGRLLDHFTRKSLHFRDIDFLILDEVDRMLDMGFLPDVRRIVTACKKQRQTLFFSATLPPAIETFAKWALKDPAEISIGRRTGVAETITHGFYPVAYEQRDELLLALLRSTDYESVMIFTRTKAEADKITALLKKQKDGFKATPMHSDIAQKDRTKALKGFRDGTFNVIVATDVAARGLDISNVTHVINYRVPENPEDYVHRIGRTGRAEQEGDAFTLLAGDEVEFAKAVEGYVGQKIDRKKLEGFNYIYTAMLDDEAPTGDALRQRLGMRRKRTGGRRRR